MWGARGLTCALSGSRAGEDREGPSWSAIPESFYSALSSLCGQGPWGKPAICPGAQGRPGRGLWLAGLMCQADPTGNGVGLEGPLRDVPPGGEVETDVQSGRAGSEGGGGPRGPRQALPCCIQSVPLTRVGGQHPGRIPFISQVGLRPEHRSGSEWAQLPSSPRAWPRAVMEPPPVKGVKDACLGGHRLLARLAKGRGTPGVKIPTVAMVTGPVSQDSPLPQGTDSPPPLGSRCWVLSGGGSWRMSSVPVPRAEQPSLVLSDQMLLGDRVCASAPAQVSLCACACMYVRACVRTCVCLSVRACMHVCVRELACTCVCTSVCVNVCLCSALCSPVAAHFVSLSQI